MAIEFKETEKAKELMKKYPKFFGEKFLDKVRGKYAKEGKTIPLLSFFEWNLIQYTALEEFALKEYDAPRPLNYLLIARNMMIPPVGKNGGIGPSFWDSFKEQYVDLGTLPHMKPFMGRLVKAKGDLDEMMKDAAFNGHEKLLDSLPAIDDMYSHVIERIVYGVPVCSQLICEMCVREHLVSPFSPSNRTALEYYLLNDYVLRNMNFSLPTLRIPKTVGKFRGGIQALKNIARTPSIFNLKLFRGEMRRAIDYTVGTYIPLVEKSANNMAEFHEEEVIKRVEERKGGKNGK